MCVCLYFIIILSHNMCIYIYIYIHLIMCLFIYLLFYLFMVVARIPTGYGIQFLRPDPKVGSILVWKKQANLWGSQFPQWNLHYFGACDRQQANVISCYFLDFASICGKRGCITQHVAIKMGARDSYVMLFFPRWHGDMKIFGVMEVACGSSISHWNDP
jgi:hypothetical protein